MMDRKHVKYSLNVLLLQQMLCVGVLRWALFHRTLFDINAFLMSIFKTSKQNNKTFFTSSNSN